MRPAARAVAVLVLASALVGLGACSPAPTVSGSPASAIPGTPSPSAPPTAAPSPTASIAVAPSASPGLAFDATLLEVLPAAIEGLPLTPTPDVMADIGADPELDEISDRLAFGVVVDPDTGELAVAAVVALAPGVFGDALWREFRDQYDAGACGQAGGAVGNAEAELGGRTVFIGTCEGGARTYHAHLEEGDLLVAITSVGDELRLGEALIAAAGARGGT